MESPLVSAFAAYKKKKNHNHIQKKKKKNSKNDSLTLKSKNLISLDHVKTANKKPKDTNTLKKVPEKKVIKKKIRENEENYKLGKNKKVKKEVNHDIHYSFNHEPSALKSTPKSPQTLLIDSGHMSDDHTSQSSGNSFDFTPVTTNSVEEGAQVFNWLIAPYNAKEFLNKIWERKPLYIERKKPHYYKDIISTPIIDNMLRTENIQYTKNLDITSYVDGTRETHNPVGRAHPHVVWDYYLNGCSIRLLNPQTYIPKLHLLNATLQEFFNSFVGANAYLTPPDSQGFAPHYDDIEAFILQIEGKKHWKIYKPLSESEKLPRVSSKNFDQDEIGQPIMEVTLKAGDMLYFPRGYIHQGITINGEHSLHVTVSAYQKHSWADLFEKMIPVALQDAINDNVELRQGLPFDIYEHFGLVNSDKESERKSETNALIGKLFDKIKKYLNVDSAVDQMSKNFMYDALPPVLNEMEKAVTVYGDSDVMMNEGRVQHRVEIGLDTKVRLLRRNILRMAMEADGIKIYHSIENSLEYHGNEQQFLEIDEHFAPAVECLLVSYPDYVALEDLDAPSESDKLQIANDLWEKGLLMTDTPLETIED